jgi:hypothetical protein
VGSQWLGCLLYLLFFFIVFSSSRPLLHLCNILTSASISSLCRVWVVLDLDVDELALVGVRDGVLHPWQGLGNLAEQSLDIVSSLSTGLDEHDVELLGLLLSLLSSNLALLIQVGLVAHKDNNHICATLSPHVVDPLGGVHERVAVYEKGESNRTKKKMSRV